MSPPHGRTVKEDGQTRVPTSSELGWKPGAYRLVVGRNGNAPVARVTPADALEPLTPDEARRLFNALAVEANDYADNLGADTAGEDATLGPPSVAGA